MAEVMVVNPRHRRRRGGRRRRRATSKRRTHRRRRRSYALANPSTRRRRRRSGRRRSHRRHRAHRNPRLGSVLGVNLTQAGGTALGIIGASLATSAVLNNIPGVPAALKSGPGKIAAKAVIGIGAGWVVSKLLKQHNLGRGIAVGGVIAALLEAWQQYAAPALPPQLQDYEITPMGEYQLAGPDDMVEEGITGLGYGENIYSDPIY
jgi:hypothetical protein